MTATSITPTKTIIQTTHLIDEAIGLYLKKNVGLRKHLRYESDAESKILFIQVIRHVEAIGELARRDLATLPSALVLTRAAFETTARILWMLHPNEVFDREARFLAHLGGEAEYFQRFAKFLEQFGHDGESWRSSFESIRNFRMGVQNKLPASIQRVETLPNLRDMLKDIGQEGLYATYMHLSQFSHGSPVAGGLYRRGRGLSMRLGEFIYPESWVDPLRSAWWCVAKGGQKILERVVGDSGGFPPPDFVKRVNDALKKI
jgi:hypothetical protein